MSQPNPYEPNIDRVDAEECLRREQEANLRRQQEEFRKQEELRRDQEHRRSEEQRLRQQQHFNCP